MSQQALDLRRSIQIVRGQKLLAGAVVVLGVLGGAAFAVLKLPMLASTALVAFPATSQQAAITTSGSHPYTATQVVVAGSYQVLLNALPHVRPAMSLDQLRHDVQVGSPSSDIISITGDGRSAADAEAVANAVADSYVKYVRSSQSAVGQVQAQVLQSASNAAGPSPIARMIIFAVLGGLAGALIGVIVALAIGRNDRRLRERDEIANSIGIPASRRSRLLIPKRRGLDEASGGL